MFASILKCVSNVRQLFAADDFSRRDFSDAFFLGAVRVNKHVDVERERHIFTEQQLIPNPP